MSWQQTEEDRRQLARLRAELLAAEGAFIAEVRQQLSRQYPRRTVRDVANAVDVPKSSLARWSHDGRGVRVWAERFRDREMHPRR